MSSRWGRVLGRLARPAGDQPLRVFCSGVGGTGLSGLARILAGLGHRVSGSDRCVSPTSEALERTGIRVAYTQDDHSLDLDSDVLVVTAALPPAHPELRAAERAGIPIVKYAQALGALVAERRGIAVSGTHGKTTTTALTAWLLEACDRAPSYLVGGWPKNLASNAELGSGQDLVFEACEYDGSFLNYSPRVALVTNVEEDHLDCYPGGLDEIVDAFVAFVRRLPERGTLVVSADCPGARRVTKRMKTLRPDLQVVTFSTEPEGGTISAGPVTILDGLASFALLVEGEVQGAVRMGVPGRHNVSNALAAIACAMTAGAEPGRAAAAVQGFRGVARRFDVLVRGEVTVVDDYAHHPTAIAAVLKAARVRYPNRRLVACFEPHQASRTRLLFDDFRDALTGADRVLLADIYACRDRPEDVESVSAADLVGSLRAVAPETEAAHSGDLDALEQKVLEEASPGDLVMFLGAGGISRVARRVATRLRDHRQALSWSGAVRRPSASLEASVARVLGDRVQAGVSVARHCTFKTGGRARFFAAPETEEEAIEIGRTFQRLGVPIVPLGGGSNVLFTGEVLDAAVLLTRRMRGSRVLGHTLRAQAGAGLQGAIRLAERNGLGGLEVFAGIPGTLGGAVFGNAGGPPGTASVGQLVRRARVLERDGRVRWRSRAELGLEYRKSDLDGCLVLAVDLELRPDDRTRLRRVRMETTARKASTQPLDARSAGCAFRNPEGGSAGLLIDRLGLKGLRRGGAQVSRVHGNFIVNEADATPQDILELLHEVQARVAEARGIHLQPELRLIA